MKKLITILSALALSATFAAAADAEKKAEKKAANPEEAFKKLDTNSDGAVTLEEFKAGPAGKRDATKAETTFKRRDKDADGKLTLEEFKPAPKKNDAAPAAAGEKQPEQK